MADIPKVAEPIEVEAEYDGRALDLILEDYNIENIPRLGLSLFRSRYLPLLVKKHPRDEDNNAVRIMWVEEVARNFRLPVFIVDDADPSIMVYRVPPLVGTVSTTLTAHDKSMATLNNYEETLKGRLSSQAARFRNAKFEMFNAVDDINRIYQIDWITIMLNEGYLVELKQTIGDGPFPDYVQAIVGDKLDNIDTNGTNKAKPTPVTQQIGLLEDEETYEED